MITIRQSVECWVYRPGKEGVEILLLHRPLAGYPSFWQPVTGGLREGETPVQAGRRETEEETGLTEGTEVRDLQIRLVLPMDDMVASKHLMAVRASSAEVRLSPEHDGFRWVPLDQVVSCLHWHSNRVTFGMVARAMGWSLPDGEVTGVGLLRRRDPGFEERLGRHLRFHGEASSRLTPFNQESHRNLLYRFQAGSRLLVAKLYSDESTWQRERRALNLARRAAAPFIPEIVHVHSFSHVELYLTVMTLLEGTGLESVKATMSPEDLRAVWQQAGELIHRVHREVPGSAFGSLWPDGYQFATAREWIHHTVESHLGLVAGSLSSGEQALVERALARLSQAGTELARAGGPHLLHSDYGERNFLVAQHAGRWRLSGVVDFEHARWGFPLLEFSKLLDHEFLDPAVREAFVAGYGGGPELWENQPLLDAIRIVAAVAILYHTMKFPDPRFRDHGVAMLRKVAG